MNVLIVDDEPMIRHGLRMLIDWESNGLNWAGDAADGQEAWDILASRSIDIVVTDLLMPRVDGMELIRRIKREGLQTAVIVLSCLDDFAYVKEAMKLGARDYLLKPTMEPEDLLSILLETQDELAARRRERRQRIQLEAELRQTKQFQLSQRVERYLTARYEATAEEPCRLPEGSCTMAVMAGGDSIPLLQNNPFGALDNLHAFVRLQERLFMLIVACEPQVSEKERLEREYAQFVRVERCLHEAGLQPESFRIGLGMALRDWRDVVEAAALHERQAHMLFYEDQASPFPASDRGMVIPHVWKAPQAERTDYLRAIAARNSAAAWDAAKRLIGRIAEDKPAVSKVTGYLYELLGLAAGYAREWQLGDVEPFQEQYVSYDRVQSFLCLEELARYLLEATAALMELRNQGVESLSARSPFVRKAVQYIREHYRENITTQDIADAVKLSRSYLCDLYSRETGESLGDTLLRYRMEEAEWLLRTGDCKVYEIAEQVGFQDAKSFAKAFKRWSGFTPKEYAER